LCKLVISKVIFTCMLRQQQTCWYLASFLRTTDSSLVGILTWPYSTTFSTEQIVHRRW